MYIHPLFQIKLIIIVAFQLMKNSMLNNFCGKMLLLSGAGGGCLCHCAKKCFPQVIYNHFSPLRGQLHEPGWLGSRAG